MDVRHINGQECVAIPSIGCFAGARTEGFLTACMFHAECRQTSIKAAPCKMEPIILITKATYLEQRLLGNFKSSR